MALPPGLTSLTAREAIADALYRCVYGLDTNNIELFESAWAKSPDVCLDMNGTVHSGMDSIRDKVFNPIGPLDTTHTISNMRVDVQDGAKAAKMTAYALAQHFRAGEGLDLTSKHLMSGGIYSIDLTHDSHDGLWKVVKWAIKFVWLEGDMSIVMG